MKLQDMTNEQLCEQLEGHNPTDNIMSIFPEVKEMRRRLCAVKSPFQVRYKFLPNDVELEKCPEETVRGTSHLNAAQTLLDANFNWLDQDMVFAVVPVGQSWWTAKYFTTKDFD